MITQQRAYTSPIWYTTLRFVRRTSRPGFLMTCLLVLLPFWQSSFAQSSDLQALFRDYVGLKDNEIRRIEEGEVISKILKTDNKPEVVVFGAVYIRARMEDYVALFRDLSQLEKYENYLAIRRFSDPPVASDLEGFVIDHEDIQSLEDCKVADCDIQLPAEGIEAFRQGVDWDAKDVAVQVNELAKPMFLNMVKAYLAGGNQALGEYRDKKKPHIVAEHFAGLVSQLKALPDYAPQLGNYLLNYPEATLQGSEDYLYWENVKFGLKATVRANHVTIYPIQSGSMSAYITVTKQLYSSHYFHTALDLTSAVKQNPQDTGFFLITVKASCQDGLTGFGGSILRSIVTRKARGSLRDALATIKEKLEEG
jgi:hypothetical protein